MKLPAAAISICLILSTGCQALVTSPTGTASTSRVEVDRRPSGSPHVDLTPENDGWTIRVTQALVQTDDIRTSTQETVRRYLFWPLAPLNGLLQCPVGLLVSAFSSHQGATTLRQVGCMRLVAMEPLSNTTAATTITEHHTESRSTEAGVTGAEIVFRELGTEAVRRQITDANGKAHLHGFLNRESTGSLTVTVANRQVFQKTLTLRPRLAAPATITIPLPTPLIVQAEAEGNTNGTRALEEQLRQSLLQSGLSVLPAKPTQKAILEEHNVQLAGQVDDRTQVRTGRLAPPTLIVRIRQNASSAYALNMISVTTGQQQEIEVESLDEIGKILRTN